MILKTDAVTNAFTVHCTALQADSQVGALMAEDDQVFFLTQQVGGHVTFE